jgi:glycosylphosphatidylinositol transamidase (GPIT) subunit GPI8
MSYTEDFLKKIIQMGILEYTCDKILNILDEFIEDQNKFIKDFNNDNSEVYKAYKKGKDKADFIIDQRLFELAKTGNIAAIEKIEQRKRYNKYKSR